MGWYVVFEHSGTKNHLKAVYDLKILGAPTPAEFEAWAALSL